MHLSSKPLFFVIFVSLFIVVLPVSGQGTTDTPDLAGLISAAAMETSAYLGETPPGDIPVSDIQTVDDWSFGITVRRADSDHTSPELYLFLARQTPTGWEVVLETDPQFGAWLQAAPEGLMSQAARATLLNAAFGEFSSAGDGSAMLRLPFDTGETQRFTGGPHDTNRAALDFAGGSGLARAAREGTVWRSGSCPNFVRIDHADGWQTGYYHLINEAVSNGQSVSGGQVVGTQSTGVGCGGSASGNHVHFSLRRYGSYVSIHDRDIGGWNVQQGAADYQGCLVRIRDGYSVCQWGYITNEGTIGTGFPAAPANAQLVRNFDFSNGYNDWATALQTNWSLSGGVLGWHGQAGGVAGVITQTLNYSLPQYASFELILQLGNSSSVTKRVRPHIHQVGTWEGGICDFYIPPNTSLRDYTIRGTTSSAWGNIRLWIEGYPPDGIPNILMDRVRAYYRPAQKSAATECISSDDGGTGTGLKAEYFDNANLTALSVTRIDPKVNFFWDGDAPAAGMGVDSFSARYTGWIEPRYSESYQFHTLSDDGVRLWINNQLVIDNWTDHGLTWNSSSGIALTAGVKVPIKLEYYENSGGAAIALQWSSSSQTRTVIPSTRLYSSVNMLANGNFASGLTGWTSYAGVNARVNSGVLEMYRNVGTASAVVFQNTGTALPNAAPLEISAQFGNSSAGRKRVSVIAHDADWSDLQVCTFWIPPGSPLQTYTMRAKTGEAWSSAQLSLYVIPADGQGWLRVDNVSMQHNAGLTVNYVTCIDPMAPNPGAGADSASLITNPGFDSMTGWNTYGTIQWVRNAGVFEFYRPTGAPSGGVIYQNTGAAAGANVPLEASFQLGNNGSQRMRATVLLHDSDFSDMQVCAFWLPPNTPLGTYTMRTHTTEAWTNISISVYPSTAVPAGFLRLDNVSLKRRPTLSITGTNCYPAGAAPADAAAFEMLPEPTLSIEPPALSTSEAPILPTPVIIEAQSGSSGEGQMSEGLDGG